MKKLTARQRLQYLFDFHSFEEVGSLICSRGSFTNGTGDGVITAFGTINGRLTFAFSQDVTYFAGTSGIHHCQKICRLIDMAVQNRAPIIGFIDSGGARIQEGAMSIDSTAIFAKKWAEISGYIPNITIICGSCAGGSAYAASMSDFNIMIENQGHMFLTGPKVIEKVLNKTYSFDDLGGAFLHSQLTGLASHVVQNEYEGIEMIKSILTFLPQYFDAEKPLSNYKISDKDLIPLLDNFFPEDDRQGYDVRNIIEMIVDEGRFLEVNEDFGTSIVVGFSVIGGLNIGIIANQPMVLGGAIDVKASQKAARFLEICDAYQIPVVFLADSPGMLPGKEQEENGILGSGGRYFQTQGNSTNPKITVIMRKLIGGAYGFMGPKGMGIDYNFAYPQSAIAVVGSDATLSILFEKAALKQNDPEQYLKGQIDLYKKRFLNPYEAAAEGIIDQVIFPRETRITLIKTLLSLQTKHVVQFPKIRSITPMG
ncbi:MAG: methylmalonyl-CoA carboxyltransferase [Chitinophagales bacterium]|nr:methylmalonyl-CoA carboxyltransferase [Chitinophagales bacterium]